MGYKLDRRLFWGHARFDAMATDAARISRTGYSRAGLDRRSCDVSHGSVLLAVRSLPTGMILTEIVDGMMLQRESGI